MSELIKAWKDHAWPVEVLPADGIEDKDVLKWKEFWNSGTKEERFLKALEFESLGEAIRSFHPDELFEFAFDCDLEETVYLESFFSSSFFRGRKWSYEVTQAACWWSAVADKHGFDESLDALMRKLTTTEVLANMVCPTRFSTEDGLVFHREELNAQPCKKEDRSMNLFPTLVINHPTAELVTATNALRNKNEWNITIGEVKFKPGKLELISLLAFDHWYSVLTGRTQGQTSGIGFRTWPFSGFSLTSSEAVEVINYFRGPDKTGALLAGVCRDLKYQVCFKLVTRSAYASVYPRIKRFSWSRETPWS